MDEIIEETLKNLDNRAENVEFDLTDQIIQNENDKNVNENENVVQENENDEDVNENENVVEKVMEKIGLKNLKWSSKEFIECETTWKSVLCSNAVKKPNEYFSTFFTDELCQKICEETNIYAMQTKGIELKCTVTRNYSCHQRERSSIITPVDNEFRHCIIFPISTSSIITSSIITSSIITRSFYGL